MARHLVVVMAGLAILLSVWFTLKVKPMLEKGKGKITIALDGQERTMTSDEIASEIVRLRRERDEAQRKADGLEQAREQLLADIEKWQTLARKAASQPKTPEPTPDAGQPSPDSTEEALKQALASTDWQTYVTAILAWIQADEESRRTGNPIDLAPEMYQLLAQYNVKATALAKLLGVEDHEEVIYHEKVAPSFMEGWLSGVGVTISDEQRAGLRELCLEHARSRRMEREEVKDANKLEKLVWLADRDIRWNADMRKLLTPEQYETYMKPAGGNAFWGHAATRKTLSAETTAGAAQLVGEMWTKSFALGEASRATVDEVATRYVQDYQRRVQDFQARYPTDPPREELMRHQVELLKLQVEAERRLGQRLTLTPEQLERVRQGTGTVLQIGWQ